MSDRISRRVAAVPPSGIRKFFDIAATMQDVISLGIGEPDFVTPDVIRAGRHRVAEPWRDELHLQLRHPGTAPGDHR